MSRLGHQSNQTHVVLIQKKVRRTFDQPLELIEADKINVYAGVYGILCAGLGALRWLWLDLTCTGQRIVIKIHMVVVCESIHVMWFSGVRYAR